MLRLLLLLLGLCPFAVGGWLHRTLMEADAVPMPLAFWSGIGLLILWALAAFLARPHLSGSRAVLCCLHAAAAADLVLIAVQELVRHAYWPGPVGLWSQLFYLPLLDLGLGLTRWSSTLFPAYAACFLLLLAAALLGCRTRLWWDARKRAG